MRPRIHKNAVITTVSIEKSILDSARLKGINISKTLQEALEKKLNIDSKFKEHDVPNYNRILKFIREDKTRAKHWSKIIKEKHKIYISPGKLIEEAIL